MGFLSSMMALLFVTLLLLVINYTCYDNVHDVNRAAYLFPLIFSSSFYSKAVVLIATWVDIIICSMFLLLVFLLFLV